MKIIPHQWLDRNKDAGILLLRIFIGLRLVYGVADNVFSWKHMQAFESFLQANHFPLPLYSAILSVYAQLICGLMILTGFHIRAAGLIMVINFLVALIMVHRNDTIEGMTPALAMLFSSVVFVFYGAGRFALRAK
jgi:putative oxidoreductase